jgi:hypothetical protein
MYVCMGACHHYAFLDHLSVTYNVQGVGRRVGRSVVVGALLPHGVVSMDGGRLRARNIIFIIHYYLHQNNT